MYKTAVYFSPVKTSDTNYFAKKGLVLPSVNSSYDGYGLLFGEIFQYKFLTHATFACLLCGSGLRHVGTYVVCRRLVFLSGGITHASFGGIGMAYYFGADPSPARCFSPSPPHWASKRHRSGKQYPRRFGHRTALVARHGIGHHLHISDPGLRTEPYELSVRQHPERHVGRSALDGGGRRGDTADIRYDLPSDPVRRIRPGIRPEPELADTARQLPWPHS